MTDSPANGSSTPQPVATHGSYSPPVLKTISQGNKEYALKQYEKAAELYGQASELHVQESGHDDPDLLFLYGKALFQVAQQNSQVLGGAPSTDPSLDPKQVLASAAAARAEPAKSTANISFSGDAEDEDEDGEGGEGDDEVKEDDFQIAWEVLETAKLLYESQLESLKGKAVVGKGAEEDSAIERKIADVCDLLGEVSIENESFDAAVQDLTRALQLKLNIYQPSDPIISEAHYKLSLALEFAQSPSPEQNKHLALQHLESAISSVQARVLLLEAQGKTRAARDAKEMIEELQIKVDEMKNPTEPELDMAEFFGGGSAAALGAKLVQSLTGRDSATTAATGANDLTGLVRKKGKGVGCVLTPAEKNSSVAGEKRKIARDDPTAVGSPGKKVRVEDVEDEEA